MAMEQTNSPAPEMTPAPDTTPDPTPEGATTAPENVGNETPKDDKSPEKRKKELAKASESIWKKGKSKIERAIDKKHNKSRERNYNFRINRLTENLLKPLDKSWIEYGEKRDRVLRTSAPEVDKVSAMSTLKMELEKEIETGVVNVIALLDQMTQTEYKITMKALAELEIYIGIFSGLMASEKAKPLTEIFSKFITLRELPEKNEYEKIIEEAFLDAEMAPIAFFVLRMSLRPVRMEFAKRFIKRNPDKTVWMIDTGNRYGCFNPPEMKTLFEYARDFVPQAKKEAEKELGDFEKYEIVYRIRFNSQDLVKKRIQGIIVNAGGNDALQMMTFKQTGRLIGYMASTMTLIANFFANKDLIMSDPSQFFKNPYVLGALGMFGFLKKTSKPPKGEESKEWFLGKGEIGIRRYEVGSKRLRDALEQNEGWSEFFEAGGVNLLAEYDQHRKTRSKFEDLIPDSNKFLEFCKKKEPQTEEMKSSIRILEEIVKKDKNKADENLANFTDILLKELREDKGGTQGGYTKILKDANEKFI